VFLQGLDEHQVGVTSVVSEFLSLSVDFVSSVVDPDQVFLGDLDFVFDVFSVCGGLISDGFVLVSDVSKV